MLSKLLSLLYYKEGNSISVNEIDVSGDKVRLREKYTEDSWNDYVWRADFELAELDAAPRLNMPFEQYEKIHKDDLRYPTPRSHKFAVETIEDSIHIGNCMYYDLDTKQNQAELGVMIGDRGYWNGGFGSEAVTLLVNYMFQYLELDRIYLKTLEWNIRAQRAFKKIGFSQYGASRQGKYQFILMELSREDWPEQDKYSL